MAFHNKCVIVVFSILYFLCKNSHCFNFTKVTGTWIVRQTSDPLEVKACPFVKINSTSSKIEIVYQSTKTSLYELTVNDSKTNVFPVKDSKNSSGNLTIYGGILPYYIVASFQIKKENATYLVLTGRLTIPESMEKNITKFLKETPALKNTTFNSTNPETLTCRRFIGGFEEDADGPYPIAPAEPITWPAATTMKPNTQHTTKKPGKNAATELSIPNFVVFFSLLFVCIQ